MPGTIPGSANTCKDNTDKVSALMGLPSSWGRKTRGDKVPGRKWIRRRLLEGGRAGRQTCRLTMERINNRAQAFKEHESQAVEGPWKKGSMVHPEVEEGQWGEQSGTRGDGMQALVTQSPTGPQRGELIRTASGWSGEE